MTVEQKIAENAKNADITTAASGFTKTQPTPFNPDELLKKGDKIHMPATPADIKVFTQFFGKADPATGDRNKAEFIVVDVEAVDGSHRAINWFPTSLTKNIWPAQKDASGKVVPAGDGRPVQPKGTAVDLYKSFQGQNKDGKTDVQLGVEALCGHVINITDVTPMDTQKWRNGVAVDEIKSTNLFQYDL